MVLTLYIKIDYRYRREWYRLMDNEENSNFGEPSSHFLDNIPFIVPLASFFPVRRPSTFPRYHKRPICTMSLEDISTKVKQNFVLCSQFFSDEPYDITWRGPAIAAKRDFVVTVIILYCCLNDHVDIKL